MFLLEVYWIPIQNPISKRIPFVKNKKMDLQKPWIHADRDGPDDGGLLHPLPPREGRISRASLHPGGPDAALTPT